MERNGFKVGQKVFFGRPNGQQTLGEIVKLNPSKAKVKTLEVRGHRTSSGEVWTVPYELIRPANADAQPGDQAPTEKLKYNPFAGIDNLILDAIVAVYSALSPEALSGDGELPASVVRRRYGELQRQLRGLLLALGRQVDESAAYDWLDSKRAYEKSRQQSNRAAAN